MKETFVYRWIDNKTGIYYIGVHKGTPDDGYTCSSKLVKQLIRERPDDFEREILLRGPDKLMREAESIILKSVNAASNSCYYNKCNSDGKLFNPGGGKRPDLTIRNLTNNPSKVGQPQHPNAKGKGAMAWKGSKHTTTAIEKMREARLAYNAMSGNTHSVEARKKISDAKKLYWENKRKTSING